MNFLGQGGARERQRHVVRRRHDRAADHLSGAGRALRAWPPARAAQAVEAVRSLLRASAMRRGVLLIAVAALVAAAASAQAQGSSRPTVEAFGVAWLPRAPSMRPV